MSAMSNLSAQVTAAQSGIKSAEKACREACYQACLPAQRERAAVVNPLQAFLDGLLETYQDRALELAEVAGQAPRSAWGRLLDPEVTVRPAGLCLSWDINGTYAPAVFVATWESLTETTEENQ